MMLAHPQIDAQFVTGENAVCSLVVENQDFFRAFLQDICAQTEGNAGDAVLSDDNRLLSFSANAELIDSYIGFTVNRKPLLTKIISALEKQAVGEHYLQTMELLTAAERLVDEISFTFPCTLSCAKLNIGTILKSVGIEVDEEGNDPMERLLDYMELTREFDRDKLFLLVNLRSYFPDEKVSLFLQTVLGHGYHVIMIDGRDYQRLPEERRVTIDKDLCEF